MADEDIERLARAIDQVITETGLPLVELARRADVSQRTLQRLRDGEGGRPRPSTLTRISEAAGRDGHDLIAVLEDGADLPPRPEPMRLAERVAELEGELDGRLDRLENRVAETFAMLTDIVKVVDEQTRKLDRLLRDD